MREPITSSRCSTWSPMACPYGDGGCWPQPCCSYAAPFVLQLARLGVAVEERPQPTLGHRNDQPEMVLQRAGLVQPADRDRVVAGVADQPLGQLPGAVLGRVQVARPHPLLVDLVV